MEGGRDQVSLIMSFFYPFFFNSPFKSICCFANLPSLFFFLFFFFWHKSYTANSFCLLIKSNNKFLQSEKIEGIGVVSVEKK